MNSLRTWLWLSLLALCGCSVLIDPNVLSIKCSITPGQGDDPCLSAGMHCVASECRPCDKDAQENCNGIDDDCDGHVDEGHDDDNDGFTWCGGGHPELRDCALDDPTIHPPRPAGPDQTAVPAPKDACDGKDNDCDTKVDEDSDCTSMRPPCTRDADCTGGQRCDVTTRICIEPRTVGSGCTDDSQCAGGFCLKKDQYDLNVDVSGGRCASACCVDKDCGAGSVCVAGSSGVRVCLPANIAARGSSAAGSGCTEDSECSSGACVGGRCLPRCSSDAGCSGAECTLSLGSIREPRRWSCMDEADNLGREEVGGACASIDPTACRSGLCADGSCAGPCGRNADCASDEVCVVGTVRALFGPTAPISYCAPRAAGVDGPRLCCTNADCGAEKLCAPAGSENRLWSMTCR